MSHVVRGLGPVFWCVHLQGLASDGRICREGMMDEIGLILESRPSYSLTFLQISLMDHAC